MPETDEFGGVVVAEPEKDEFGGIVAPEGKDEFGGNVVTETRPEKKARLKREIAAIPDVGTGWLSRETLKNYPEAFSELSTSPLTRPDEETNAAIDRIMSGAEHYIGGLSTDQYRNLGGLAKGGAHLLKGAVDFVTSPKGIAVTAAQATPLAPAVNAYISAEQAAQVPAAAQRAGELSVTGTPEEQIAANTDLGAAVVTPGLMAPAIGRPEFAPTRLTPEDFDSSRIRPEDEAKAVAETPAVAPPAPPVMEPSVSYAVKPLTPESNDPIRQQGTGAMGVRPEETIRQGVGEENGLPQPAATGETETSPQEEITRAVTGPPTSGGGEANSGALAGFKNFISNLAGETLPKTHRADRETGEAGARLGSSRVGAQYAADAFVRDILRDKVDGTKFQAALTEDNLRSIRDNFLAKGEEDAAAHVRDIFDMAGSPFKNEEEYQAFLKEPETQAAVERYKERRERDIEPLYKQARDIDPNVELPGRGQQTGARTNLYVPDEETGGVPQIRSTPNLRATFKRRTRFANPASGAAEQYGFDFQKAMENTYSGLYEIANKNAFDKKLVDTGNAVIAKPGERVVLPDGEATESFPLKAQTLVNRGSMVPRNQDIYVRKSLAQEYAGVSNARKTPPALVQKAGNFFNKAALVGLTDATVHVSNLATAILTRPGIVGGSLASDTAASLVQPAYAIASLGKALAKGLKDNTEQLSELAQMGALREKHQGNWVSKGIGKIDQLVRLSLDDTYQELARRGIVEDTEQARREFVNQVGQYNNRLTDYWTSLLKQSGASPFLTAGKTFNTLGVRNAVFAPGVEATSNLNALALRANVIAKAIGTFSTIAAANYLLTGKATGRPGTPLGRIDTGNDDSAGRPLTVPALDIAGFGRGYRVTGVRGAVEAARMGLTKADMIDAAKRDIANSIIGPVGGPIPRFAIGAVVGRPAAVGIGRGDYEAAAPGESQTLKDVKQAAIEVNPTLNAIHTLMQPGKTWRDFVAKQFPRFTPQPGKPASMVENYPEIVQKAQAGAFVDDVIHRARQMDQESKVRYLQESLMRLPESERAHAWQEIKRRKVLLPGR